MDLLTRLEEFLLECLRNWGWLFPLLLSGFFLYRIASAFLPVKPGRRWKSLLFVLLSGVTGMVIWVGDENLILTLPVFFAVFLACSRGDRVGRLAVTAIFFCLIMPVCALLDTYYARDTCDPSLNDFRSCTNRLKSFQQSAKSGNGTNRLSRTDRYFIIFGKAAGVIDPCQRTLNNPPLGQDLPFRLDAGRNIDT